jgi:hypothetical protein
LPKLEYPIQHHIVYQVPFSPRDASSRRRRRRERLSPHHGRALPRAYFNGLHEAKAQAQAYDPDARRQLLALSLELTGLSAEGVAALER